MEFRLSTIVSFYRKYRPQKLAEVIGQEHVCRTFRNALQRSALAHAYLFSGSRGTGKTSMARIIARALNCENISKEGEPCNECSVCHDALTGRLIDLIEIDAASNRGIDEIRELKEKIIFAPSRAKVKIYIIDEVHMLTKEAFNALLKTLEEPPDHAYFILATTEAHRVPETILSRCQRFDFHRISIDEITDHLLVISEKENIVSSKEALRLIANQAAGGMRDALGMLEQLGAGGEVTVEAVAKNLGLTRPATVEEFMFAILFRKLLVALKIIDGLVREGVNLIQFNKNVLVKLREQMLQKIAENKISEAKSTLAIINEFMRAGEDLKTAIIPQLPLEIAVILVCGEKITTQPIAVGQKVKKEFSFSSQSVQQKSSPDSVGVSSQVEKEELKKSVSSQDSNAISFTFVKKVFPQVLEKLKTASLKLALKECSVLRTEDSVLTLGVGSDFLLERLSTAEAKNELTEVFSMVLDSSIQVSLERAEIKLAPAAPADTSSPKLTKEPSKKKNLVEAASDLFEEGW